MLNDITIKSKLRIYFTSLSVLVLLVGILCIFFVRRIENRARDLYNHPFQVTASTKSIQSEIRNLFVIMLQMSNTTDHDEIVAFSNASDASEELIEEDFLVLQMYYLGDMDDIDELYDLYKVSVVNRDVVIEHMLEGEFQEAYDFVNNNEPTNVNDLLTQLQNIEDFASNKAIELQTSAEQEARLYIILTIVTSVGVVVISLVLLSILINSIYPPINQIVETIDSYKKGGNKNVLDLSRKDELGLISTSFNEMLDYLKTQDEIKILNLELANLRDKENLRITLMSIGDGVITTDVEGIITNINPIASVLTGYTPIEAIGKTYNEVFHIVNKHSREKVVNPIEQVINSGKIVGLANHTVLISRDNKEYDISDSGAPIITEDGKIVGVVLVFRDITKEYKSREEIEYLSWHDSLTGLKNRDYLEKKILNLQESKSKNIGIIMGDVNGLKIANDAFGHAFGDLLLQEISVILNSAVPEDTTIVRWGGDEFVLILENINKYKLDAVCKNITTLANEFDTKSPVQPSISLGNAMLSEDDNDIYKALIRAEDMMYENKLVDKDSLRSKIVSSLEVSLFEKSYETEEHALRVAEYSKLIATKINLPQNEINKVVLLSKLHDIGKIAIDDTILQKPDKLTSDEWRIIKKHPEAGYRIASSLNDLTHIAEGILCHHEHYDGSGYPRGLKGKEIPVLARIVSIADAFDVMISNRSYKTAMSKDKAIKELIDCKGTQFDPNFVDVFINEIMN